MKNSAFFLVLTFVSNYFAWSADGAEVNINLTEFQDGIFSVPENQEQGQIKVDLTEAVNSAPVTIVCSVLETGPGLTSVEFRNSSAPVGATQVDVTFRILSAGRAVAIQCSGQSDGNNKQFTFSSSKGNNGSLRVTKAPTLHVCPDVVLLHKYLPKSTFQVQFSERIRDLPVDVRCSIVESVGDTSGMLQLNFTETRVGVDAATAQVPYEIVSVGSPVQVICRAQSSNVTLLPVSSSSTPRMSPSTTHQVTSSVNGINVTAASVSSALSISGSASVGGGGAKKRRRRSVGLFSHNRTVLQYWFNNSAGPPVTFAMDVAPLRILPPAGFIRAPSGSFNAVLVLDEPAENTVDVTCSLDIVAPGTQLENTSELCLGSRKDIVTFANTSIKLNKKDIQFQKDELFQRLSLTLSGSPARRTQSLVRVTCCGQDTGLSLRYANQSAVAFTWVELRKLQPIDWNSITTKKWAEVVTDSRVKVCDLNSRVQTVIDLVVSRDGERKSTLVSDIDLTCPCDLKENSCDTGCCCDQDCDDFENKSSNCIPGFFGGATSEKPFEFSCQASWPDSRDWQPFLCVTINNSPVIGYFYNVTSPPLAQDATSFSTLADKKKREVFTFIESEERQTNFLGDLYSAGTTIKTAANTEDVNYARATLGILNLPQSVFNGLCLQNAAVRFLEDLSSGCVLELEESLCNSKSPWSALNYLMPNKLSRPACPLPPAVLAEGRLNDTVGGIPEISTTEVQYYCADISEYVSKAGPKLQDSVNSSSLFESNTKENTAQERCEFDDGETLPPAPGFNQTTRICSNMVVKVEYEFKWRERRIDAVQAKVTLGDVEIPTSKANSGLATSDNSISTVSQSFSVKVLHSPELNSSIASQTPFQRSGNPGYVRGLPVLGRLQNNSGQVTVGKIQLWSPGSDSLCASSTLTPVLYGENSFSGCLLRLSLDDINNCSSLRETILTNQARLVQATHVGRTGNADLAFSDDWLPVISESPSNNSGLSSEQSTCSGIPSGLVIEMLVTEAGKYAGVPQMEVVGTKISYQYTTWKFKCVSGYGLSCSLPGNDTSLTQVVPSPSTIIATAASSSVNLNITNASVTPAKQNSSSSENGTEAREYAPHFQYFMITSSVVFVKVAAVKPRRVKRTADQTGICYRDVCKEELFLPLTEAYQGEPRDKALALSLFLIFLALVTFAVTKPWG